MMKKNKASREELCDILADSNEYIKWILSARGATIDQQEEIAQATIFEGYKRLGQLREPEKLRSWLATVAVRLYIKECERNKKLFRYEQDDKGEEIFIEKIAADEDAVIREVEKHEEQEYFAKLVCRLEGRDRSIILLRYNEGMSLKDIALTLDMNYNTVRSMHARALAKLRNVIDREKGEAGDGQQR